jgi:xylose isomerase
LNLDEKFALMAEIDGYDGVEIVYPYEVSDDPAATRQVLDKYGLNVAAVNVNVKAEPEFRNGGLTSHLTRGARKSGTLYQGCQGFCPGVGADKVTCCPLGDGYEFSFQYDYAQAWKHLVEGFGEAGDYKREIPLFVEYKPSETRGRCFIDSAAKALCLLNDIGNNGHGRHPGFRPLHVRQRESGRSLAMLAESPYKYYIHINDNDGRGTGTTFAAPSISWSTSNFSTT